MRATRTDSPIRSARRLAVGAFALLGAIAAALALTLPHEAESATGDNVIFILTDDQAASELAAMPNTSALIGGQGVTFGRAYVPYPLCCPSRASLLSGQYLHNHGVRGNIGPHGGWTRFIPHESNALPVWTKDAGYYNVHLGKYMNGYASEPSTPLPVPAGWDEWYGKVSEGPLYFNYQLIEKTGPGDTPELAFYGDQDSEYQTDVLSEKAVEFIDTAGAPETPFMMNVWFNAPHGPFDPAPRHLFTQTGPLPKVQAFNEKDVSDKPKWLRKQAKKKIGRGLVKTIEIERRRRLEMLRSVDEGVGAMVAELAQEGILDDTYIVFASDNGFFRGEHRIAGGKYLAYEPSARVPLMIRGPGIPAGGVSDELVSSLDITQTVVQIATGSTDDALDGRSLLPYAENTALRSTRPILLEADTGPGQGSPGFDPESANASVARVAKARLLGRRGVKNLDQEKMATKSVANGNFAPAYRAVRTDRYLYVLYANKQSELYDMRRDPAQLRNVAGDRRYRAVRRWLFRHMVGLTTCSGPSCRVEVGADPRPRKKKPRPKPKRKKQAAEKLAP
jgi:arylsulfatase A-like enzyme